MSLDACVSVITSARTQALSLPLRAWISAMVLRNALGKLIWPPDVLLQSLCLLHCIPLTLHRYSFNYLGKAAGTRLRQKTSLSMQRVDLCIGKWHSLRFFTANPYIICYLPSSQPSGQEL
ncbi:hypothetical protein SKAU_G00066120 [Synaphobranchus kaupii]|uniref:Uncharacterized protein n=1 Tax=Synaphobranchus kaupii TaxID=118154 RepID=A0A9Q1G6X6_SYNKA|nr:hypothetical protein SKAU_G00066120 [Synaphobranchus kaupii]